MRQLRERGASEHDARTFVDGTIPAVEELATVLTPATQLAHSYVRMEHDLAAGADDLREALASSEGDQDPDPHVDQGATPAAPSDEDAGDGTVH